MGSYQLIEHTADMGIDIQGDDPADLFLQAALGLLAIISAPMQAVGRQLQRVQVAGEDRGELLVNWLNEIIYLLETKGFYPLTFHIDEAGEKYLQARIEGEPFDPSRHPVEREVKAVTYHRLRIEEVGGRWRAQVFVDL